MVLYDHFVIRFERKTENLYLDLNTRLNARPQLSFNFYGVRLRDVETMHCQTVRIFSTR